jgi:hypothetical protein
MAYALSASFGDGSDWSELDSAQGAARILYAVRGGDRSYFSPQDVESSDEEDLYTSEDASYSRDR